MGCSLGYKAPGDLQVKYVAKAVINIGLVRLPPQQCPKVGSRAPKWQLKNYLFHKSIIVVSFEFKEKQ